MNIVIVKESAEHEHRVAITPELVKKYTALGATIFIEEDAGLNASFTNKAYEEAGATLFASSDSSQTISNASIILAVQLPTLDNVASAKAGTTLIALAAPFENHTALATLAQQGLNIIAMEFVPRISRAQSMDALSSQSNLAGYKAVLDATAHYKRALPMMMTAAGTIPPAQVLILGAGVAGLQAIATAKRLGAVVSAFDVRPAVKTQVQSLGGKFIEVADEESQDAETAGGYAKEMSEAYKQKQQEAIHQAASKSDIIISTALIPGKPAPILISEEMVKAMKAGSVIVDLAVSGGGNCTLSQKDQIVEAHNVTIIGHSNVPSRIASDASKLYSNNLYQLIAAFTDNETQNFTLNQEDEIIQGALISFEGKLIHPQLQGKT